MVALLYAMVGHGGASGYLAVMAFLSIPVLTMRPTALVLNLCVSAVAFIAFARKGHFQFRTFWPFALTSIPLAWIGGGMQLNAVAFKILLGLFLLVAAARMMGFLKTSESEAVNAVNIPLALLLGALLGLFSGILGIGGGIILSPLILLLSWAKVKTTAATSALFIFVNSAAGLAGVDGLQSALHPNMLGLLASVFAGALIGAYLGSIRYTSKRVQRVLSVLLLLAAVKLLLQL